MKMSTFRVGSWQLVAVLATHCVGAWSAANPIDAVIELLKGLQQKIITDKETAQTSYEEFAKWCEHRSMELHQDIKVGKAELDSQSAIIEQATDAVVSLSSKIDALSSEIASDEHDLADATAIRNSEEVDFKAAEASLQETISALERAINMIQRESGKGDPSALAGATSLAQVFSVMVDASGLSFAGADRLAALLQSSNSEGGEDMLDEASELLGAPAAAAYESHSGRLVQTLEGLLDKAQGQLEETRTSEAKSRMNFELLKQSLEDKIKVNSATLEEAKKDKGAAGEKKANSEKSLSVADADVKEDVKSLSELHHDCMTRAEDFEEATKARSEELKAIVEAKKIISESTGGAEKQTYGSSTASFLQLRQRSFMPGDIQAIHLVRQLAKQDHSVALAQLASRMDRVIRSADSSGDDVFGKVKQLLQNMISKLESEGGAEAEKKAYCDKEMTETASSKVDKDAEVEKLTAKIATMTSQITALTQELVTLQTEMSQMAKSQAELDQMRRKENAQFLAEKADMEQGIEGVQRALRILRDYYALADTDKGASKGAGDSIIAILEVAESDFSKGISQDIANEDAAQKAYEQETQETKLLQAEKSKDIDYKTKESKALAKDSSEFTADLQGTQTELAAVEEYFAKVKEQCIAKAEPYEERKKRRENEMEGLKSALRQLGGGDQTSSFLQVRRSRASPKLRGPINM